MKNSLLKVKVTVLLRVYNRIDDLISNLRLIRNKWRSYDYYILVAFNGEKDGYSLPDIVYSLADKVLVLPENAGHLKGNSQLLVESYHHIPSETDYLILLEADTWVIDDCIIKKYIEKMKEYSIVWASSEWNKVSWSLGIDLALVDFKRIRDFYINLFSFEKNPEQWVACYLRQKGLRFIYIKELMPVHIPKLLNIFLKFKDKRINIFLKAKVITHHVEQLKKGVYKKYAYANAIMKEEFFDTDIKISFFKLNIFYRLIYLLCYIIPQSSWFRDKRCYFKDMA